MEQDLSGTSIMRLFQKSAKSLNSAESHVCSPWFSPDVHPLLLGVILLPIPNAISPGSFFWQKFSSLHSQAGPLRPNPSGRPLVFGASFSLLSPSSSLPSTVSPSHFAETSRRKSKNMVLRVCQCNPSKPGLMAFSFAGLAYP